jgi:hypothetical protein
MIHDNQRACGDQILDAFKSDNPFVLLLAQMQMGKSGTYWHVIIEALRSKMFNRVFLISGNREKELRQQIKADVKLYTKDNTDLRKKINVLWGGDLSSKKKPMVSVPSNTLIVWDEAHYAQSTANGPNKFFEHNDLNGMLNGSMELSDILKRRIFLLTVSATPFSELYANHENPCEYHKTIRLIPDKSYCGVDYYIKNGRINESFQITTDNVKELREIMSKYNDPKSPKYMLIRICQNRGQTSEAYPIISSLCTSMRMNCEVMNSTERTITTSDLNKKPKKPTVIILCGMLRMGKVVPKEHIAMVFEEQSKRNTRLADTGLQGLLGRMCGYPTDKRGFNIDVYLEPKIIEHTEAYSEAYDSVSGPLIKPAMNLKNSDENALRARCVFKR